VGEWTGGSTVCEECDTIKTLPTKGDDVTTAVTFRKKKSERRGKKSLEAPDGRGPSRKKGRKGEDDFPLDHNSFLHVYGRYESAGKGTG